MIIRTDNQGRALCPACGSRLYLEVVERHYGLPAYYNHDEGCFQYNTWDADTGESDVERLVCHRCDFAASLPENRRSYYDEDVDLRDLQFVAAGG